MAMTYKEAGVDIDLGNQLAARFLQAMASTDRAGTLKLPGGFAGLFDLKEAGLGDGVLVLATDGVGTKIQLAKQANQFSSIGIDLVAMCVNDILTLGAQPIAFLDYMAYGKLDETTPVEIVESVAAGCRQAGCALLGGETAEMPGVYGKEDFDLAGFALGVVKREEIIDGSKIKDGDVLVGLPSSGVHSNGFTLVRRILSQTPDVESIRISELLTPTRIYVETVKKISNTVSIHGMAHITGGGMAENIARIIPGPDGVGSNGAGGLCAEIEPDSWSVPQIFAWLAERGQVESEEMYRVFNMGIGYVLVVDEKDAAKTCELAGTGAVQIGRVRKNAAGETQRALLA